MTPEERLAAMGLTLPALAPPAATFDRAARTGNLVFLSGHGPVPFERGRLGDTYTVEQGYAAARSTALALLASLKAEIGELSRVRRLVKVLGMVNCVPTFQETPRVINGASDLFVAIFGEAGKHARSAVGMASLPGGMP
ncbi:MAG: RidA family protein, partial [Dehalococcoidia bacterium]|nr:RidA family protein [Dehalococcoidia bacterium]